MRFLKAVLLAGLSVLPIACDWVDSTGQQSGREPETEVFLDEAPVGGAIMLREDSLARITASRNGNTDVIQSFRWSETPVAEGNLEACSSIDGFDQAIAAASLQDACTEPDSCQLSFQQQDDGSGEFAEFLMHAPVLRAPVGVRHTLTVSVGEASTKETEYEFCLIAINEAPAANDDTYVVLEGHTLEVAGDSEDSLLFNDSDDDDVRNQPMQVLLNPFRAPGHTRYFELLRDGGFIYTPIENATGADVIDEFQYEVTDGLFNSSATVTVRTIVSNQAPLLSDELPYLTLTSGAYFEQDLSGYFNDPEGSDLRFSFIDGEFPEAGSLGLTPEGLLAGTPDADDIGSYALTLEASDGRESVTAELNMEVVEPAPPLNNAPEYVEDSVFNQAIDLGEFIDEIYPDFSDPDGDTLFYSSVGEDFPFGVTIDPDTGTVSGRPRRDGLYSHLQIEASDASGDSAVSDEFYIRVR
ncbi:MAG: Ig-like domain-containing protein [Granulosicoccus sp.]